MNAAWTAEYVQGSLGLQVDQTGESSQGGGGGTNAGANAGGSQLMGFEELNISWRNEMNIIQSYDLVVQWIW